MTRHATLETASAANMLVRPARSLSDWLGSACFATFALLLPLTSGSAGLLLLAPMLHEIVVAVSFLIRGRARRLLPGVGARFAAYGATFIMPVFWWTAQRWSPGLVAVTSNPMLIAVGSVLWLAGAVLVLWPLWYMRRSFSIEPAARDLVTAGPYRLARHPIYATQILMFSGFTLVHATLVHIAVLIAWLAVLSLRVRYEERVLSAEYPEYERYRSRVGAFGPWPLARRAAPAH